MPAGAQRVVVARITDGDTFRAVAVEDGLIPTGTEVRVRLLEVDAPERGACGADEATAALDRAAPVGAEILLVADRDPVDRFGRELRYVYDAEGAFVQEELVAMGVVWTVLFEPNDRLIDRLRIVEEQARRADVGVWGPPCDRDGDQPSRTSPVANHHSLDTSSAAGGS